MTTSTHALERVETEDGIQNQLGALTRSGESVVRGALLATDDPSADLAFVLQKRCSNVQTVWMSSAGRYIRLQTTRKRRSETKAISGELLVVPTQYDRMHVAFTLASPEFVKELLIPLLDRCNPRVFLPYVTSKSLAKVVLSASRQTAVHNFEVTDFGARSRIENKKSRRLRSDRTWTEEPIETVLGILRERSQWLHSLSFRCDIRGNDRSTFCAGHMSRRCTFRVRGDFQWFNRHVIKPTTDEAAQTMRFYANRARQITPSNDPRPIVIEYPEPVFRDKTQNKRLIHCLNRLPKANVSVIHANPYFHASVVDFTDGSSYEIWVLSENRIIVTPQFRATSSSTERVCDHILSSFEEGDVKDFQEVVYAQ